MNRSKCFNLYLTVICLLFPCQRLMTAANSRVVLDSMARIIKYAFYNENF